MDCLVLRFFVFVLLAFLAGADRAAGQRTYENTEYGFSFKPPKDWTSVPPRPGEKTTVVKYKADRAQTARKVRVTLTPDLEVLVFEKVSLTGESQDTAEAIGFDGYLQDHLSEAKPLREAEERTFRKNPLLDHEFLVETGRVPVRIRAFEFKGGLDVVLLFKTMDEFYDRVDRDFERSARTFQWIEREGRKKPDENLSSEEQYLQSQIDDLPPGWTHRWSSKERYLLLYNVEEDFARSIGKRLEAMRDYYEEVFPPTQPITAVSTARICSDRDTYRAYGGPPGAAGHWSPSLKELVIYDNRNRGRNYVMKVVNHEAFHQYIYYFYGKLAPHSWYNEGTGDYFSGARLNSTGSRVMRIEEFDWRFPAIVSHLRRDEYVPLKEFLNYSQGEYYDPKTRSRNYMQGWSFIYFLRNGRKEGGKVKKEWIRMLDEYLQNLVQARDELLVELDEDTLDRSQQEKAQKRAYELTFSDWNEEEWRDMQEAWLEFYL